MSNEADSKLPRGSVMNVLSILIAAAALVFAVSSHSNDNTAELEQRVSANESAIKGIADSLHQDHIETNRRLDAFDGRQIDMYHVLLDMQQHQDDQRNRK